MRPKKRYILFRLELAGAFSFEQAKKIILFFLQRFFGAGFSEKQVLLVGVDTQTGFGIIRCRREAVQEVKKALGLYSGSSFKIRVVLVSGSIKKLKEKAGRNQ